ncbi:MAG: hypothetical protein EP343_33625 [Deltaproteobacteria bacterium]|nr:MAG: hypothetical protein EP343_33625 [Deltaproteobacteria bacterium]
MLVNLIIVGAVLLGMFGLYQLMRWVETNDNSGPISMSIDPNTDVEEHFTWITPTLAIGSVHASIPPQCWQHFDAILNVSMLEHDGIQDGDAGVYAHIGFPDRETEPFTRKLDECVAYLHEQQAAQRKTLVHCMAGASRSVSVVAYYLKQTILQNDSIDTIYDKLKERRWQVEPYPGFVEYLRSLESSKE